MTIAATGDVTASGSQMLTNKTLDNTTTLTLKDANFTLQDDGDTTKQAKFQLSGITAGQTRTLTVPDASTTLVGTAATQTLSNKTLDNTTAITVKDTGFTLQDDADTTKQAVFQLSGISTGQTRTYTVPNYNATLASLAGTESLTNKTLDNTCAVTLKDTSFTLQDDGDTTKQVVFQLSGITTGTTRTLTVPNASSTIATLANKLEEFSAATDVTTLNATTSAHGLMPKGAATLSISIRVR